MCAKVLALPCIEPRYLSAMLLLLLLLAGKPVVALGQLEENGGGEPLALSVVEKASNSTVMVLFRVEGKTIGYARLTYSGIRETSAGLIAEKALLSVRLNTRLFLVKSLGEVKTVIMYRISGEGKVSEGVRVGGSFYGLDLSKLLPVVEASGKRPVFYRIESLDLLILSKKDNRIILVAGVDLDKVIEDSGLPLLLSPDYPSYVPKLSCILSDVKLVKCVAENLRGYRFAELYIAGEPSVFTAYRLYLNPVGLKLKPEVPFNLTVTIRGTTHSGAVFEKRLLISEDKPIAVHNMIPARPCTISSLIVNISTSEEYQAIDVASMLGGYILLTEPPYIVEPENVTVLERDGNRVMWAVEFRDMIPARPTASLVEGAEFWRTVKTGPAAFTVEAVFTPEKAPRMANVKVLLDDGNILSFNLTVPGTLFPEKYTVERVRLEATVVPGILYLKRLLAKLEDALEYNAHKLSIDEQYIILAEINRIRQKIAVEEAPRFIAYGFIERGARVETSNGLLVVLHNVSTVNATVCSGDLYVLVGRNRGANNYFVEVPAARTALLEGTYGVYVKYEMLKEWIEDSGVEVVGVSLHTDCPSLSLDSIEVLYLVEQENITAATKATMPETVVQALTAIVFVVGVVAFVSNRESLSRISRRIKMFLSSIL